MRESRIVYTRREREYKKSFSRRKAIFVLSLFILFSALGGAVYLLRLPRWQIQKISAEGLETLREEEVAAKTSQFLEGCYAYLIPRRSIAVASIEALEHFLKKEFLIISSVKVYREYPDALKIHIRERKLWAIYCNDLESGAATSTNPVIRETSCAYIDGTGFLYEKAPNSTGSLILKIRSDEEVILFGSQAIPAKKAEKMKRIAERFKQKLGIEIAGYELFSKIPGEVRVVTAEGFKIWLKLDDDIEATAKVLKTVLDEEIGNKRGELEYIDARFGNKVFYKLRK